MKVTGGSKLGVVDNDGQPIEDETLLAVLLLQEGLRRQEALAADLASLVGRLVAMVAVQPVQPVLYVMEDPK